MLLDANDPRGVIARAPESIMEPEHDFETKGLLRSGIVFPTGNVVIHDELFVYYGAASPRTR